MRPSRNIIERGRSAQALRESDELFRALFETVGVWLVICGPNAEVLSSNPAAPDLLGVTEEELLGTNSFGFKVELLARTAHRARERSTRSSRLLQVGSQCEILCWVSIALRWGTGCGCWGMLNPVRSRRQRGAAHLQLPGHNRAKAY
jgi:PAS domain-containing protein